MGSELSGLLTLIQAYHGKWNKKDGGATDTIRAKLAEHWGEASGIFTDNEAAIGEALKDRYHRIKQESEQLMSKPRPRDVKKGRAVA